MENTVNQLLYQGREKCGLTLRQGAKLLKVPAFILKRLEYGYWRVSKKLLARAGSVYGIEEELASATQTCVTLLPEKAKQKSNRKDLGLLKMIASFVGLLISIVLVTLSALAYQAANFNNLELYGDEFNALYSYVYDCDEQTANYEGEYGTVTYTTNHAMLLSKLMLMRSYEFYDGGGEVSMMTSGEKYPCDKMEIVLEVDGHDYICTAYCDHTNQLRQLDATDESLETVTDTAVLGQLTAQFNEIYKKIVSDFNGFYSSVGFDFDYSVVLVEEYAVIKVVTAVFLWSAAGLYFVPIAIICLFVLCVLTTVNFVKKRRKAKAIKAEQAIADSAESVIEDSENLENLPLRKRRKSRFAEFVTPIFHENILRAIGLIMLTLGSLVPYLIFIRFFGELSEDKVNFISAATPYLKMGVPVATVLLFFTKIDILTYRKSYKVQLLQYGIIGFVFYYEILLTLVLFGITQYPDVMKILSSVLPGNMFLGMFSYTLLALFLFYTPKRVKTKGGIYLWRSLSILPLGYVAVSVFVLPYLSVSPIVSELFYSNSLVPSLSAVGYILVRFVFDKVQNKVLPLADTGALRLKSLTLIKNFSACAVVGLVVLIQFLFSLSDATAVLSGGESAIALIALPFIALYQPRLEPRSRVQDVIYVVLYGLAFSISYILILTSPLTMSLLKVLKDVILK